MIRIVRKSFHRLIHSTSSYICFAMLILFYGMNVVSSRQAPFLDAQAVWDHMSSDDQSMYLLVSGYDDASQAVAHLQETNFSAAFSPQLWLILCAILSLVLFLPEKKANHFDAALYAGCSRTAIAAAHFVLCYAIALPFFFLITLLFQWVYNSSWVNLPTEYILRNFAMAPIMLFHYCCFFTAMQLSIKSATVATIATVCVCGLLVIFTVITSSLEFSTLFALIYALISSVVFCFIAHMFLQKRDFA